MQTTPLPASSGATAASPASPARAGDKSVPDGAFSLVLTQEMSQQAKPAAPQPAPASGSPEKPVSNSNSNNPNKEDSIEQADAAPNAPPAKAGKADPRKTDTAIRADAKTDAPVDETADKAESPPGKTDASAPADMLAFMANLQQIQAGRPDTPAAPVPTAAETTMPAAKPKQTGAGILASRPSATQSAQNTGSSASAKPAYASEKPDVFASRLADAGRQASTPDGTPPVPTPQEAHTALVSNLPETISKLSDPVNTAMPLQAAQLPGIQALQSVAGQPSEKLTPPVGSPAWDQALGQKIVWMASGDQQSATLTLNPPDLGPLQIVLNVNNAQADATFTAAQPEVRQALESALPKLRDMLGEAGIQLGQASVNSGAPGQQGSFEQQQSPNRGGYRGQNTGVANSPPQISRVQMAMASGGQGLVDTFA